MLGEILSLAGIVHLSVSLGGGCSDFRDGTQIDAPIFLLKKMR